MTTNPDHLSEPDEVADAIFERILRDEATADADFARLFVRGHAVVLATNDPPQEEAPEPAASEGAVAVKEAPAVRYQREEDDSITGTDSDGDVFSAVYDEAHGPDGALVPSVYFAVNGKEAYRLRLEDIPTLVKWLGERLVKGRRAQRRHRS